MKILLIAFLLSVGISLNVDTQQMQLNNQITIKGKVTDNQNYPLIGVNIQVVKTTIGTITDVNGEFELSISNELPIDLKISYVGYIEQTIEITENKEPVIIMMQPGGEILEEIVVSGMKSKGKQFFNKIFTKKRSSTSGQTQTLSCFPNVPNNTEQYEQLTENTFKSSAEHPLSTFSLDVDRAAYSNVRRFLNNGVRPPSDAVRIEEMINYFSYDYSEPAEAEPLAIHNTLTDCPWNAEHQVLHIGMQARKINEEKLPPSNLVFLIDVSGSMNAANKLPLVRSSFLMLLEKLRPVDRVAIVTYAGNAGVVLESTPASEKAKIIQAITTLRPGGSTAGAEGILSAYALALSQYIEGGNNRVILATDGDFNVGVNSANGLETLIEKKRKSGIYLTVLGYGMGNYKDEQMQRLANKGNGNHAYIDNIQEAQKVLLTEFAGTMHTIAKDVKLQIEFNPTNVAAYRLVGYENRMLEKEDFNNDQKDAGEIGYGHQMTAIYEIVPAGNKVDYIGQVDELKYQNQSTTKSQTKSTLKDELATVKFRYKNPEEDKSQLKSIVVSMEARPMSGLPSDVQFSIAVAEFGQLLRESDYNKNGNYKQVIDLAKTAKGNDEDGYRSEFIRLAQVAARLHEDFASHE